MSLLIDQFAVRAAAERQQQDEQRFKDAQARLQDSQNLPPDFRARVRRMDLAARQRQERFQSFAKLLATGLIIAAALFSATWHARRSFQSRQARRAAQSALAVAPPLPPVENNPAAAAPSKEHP